MHLTHKLDVAVTSYVPQLERFSVLEYDRVLGEAVLFLHMARACLQPATSCCTTGVFRLYMEITSRSPQENVYWDRNIAV